MAWIRLDTDFFTNDEICDMSVPGRYAVLGTLSYIKAHGGLGKVKATALQIARSSELSVNSVEEALTCKMFKVEGKLIQVVKWQDFQIDPTNADRQAAYRERQKDDDKVTVTSVSNDSNASNGYATATPTLQDTTAISSLVKFHIEKCPAPEANGVFIDRIYNKIKPIFDEYGQEFTEQLLKLYSPKAKQGDGMGLIKRGVAWLISKNREKACDENTKDAVKADKTIPRETKPVDGDAVLNEKKRKIRRQAEMIAARDAGGIKNDKVV